MVSGWCVSPLTDRRAKTDSRGENQKETKQTQTRLDDVQSVQKREPETYIRARQARRREGRTQSGVTVGPTPHGRVGERQERGRGEEKKDEGWD